MELIELTGKNRDGTALKIASAARPDFGYQGADFLQSDEWRKVLENEGQAVRRVGALEAGEIQAAVSLARRRLFGSYFYWYAPRGFYGDQTAVKFIFSELRKEARGTGQSRGALFLRFEPIINPAPFNWSGRLVKTLDGEPRLTSVLDLRRSEPELLAALHPKTRYNIRLAEKKGVTVVLGGQKDAAEFWRLLSLTAGRDDFRLHGQRHYENLLAANPGFIKLFLARLKGRNIAAGLFAFYDGRAIYLHGASDNAFREAMAPQLLQWEAIKSARASGGSLYDFYGLDEKKWPGVTRFKRGFSGREIEYPGTFDLVFKPGAYRLYNWLRKLRRRI